MTFQVAIIGSDESDEAVADLRQALKSQGVPFVVGPAAEPREVLRWTMNLEPKECGVCVFADSDGRNTASLATALHPSITPIAWCPSPADPARFPTILADTPVLVCFVKNPKALAQLVQNLLASASASASPSPSPFSGTGAEKKTAKIEELAPRTTSNAPIPSPPDDNDIALYRQLETAMAAPVKKVGKTEPVPAQKPALDFSIPLRRLMTQGHKLAHSRSHMEVLGAHYLAALDEPYLSAFTHGGLDPLLLKDYLSGFDSGEDITMEPVISDEVFEAVSQAKHRARTNDTDCVRVADFLHGLLQNPGSSLSEILQDAQLTTENFLEILDEMDSPSEVCAAPFFKPSSLDQASFYQFDSLQVRDVEERLRDLPGFQKATERVAEARVKQGAAGGESGASDGGAAPTPSVIAPVAADAPDKPEMLKIAGEFPSVDVIEHVADRLLEGQIIGFPSDIMFALAADAANPAAVERLRETADLPDEKPLSILIHSTSQLKHLVKADLDALEPLFDELWPGPLTLIFKSAGAIRRHISSAGTVAVRQPADNTSLAILSMLGRPMVVTSWDKPKDQLTGQAAIIIEADAPPQPVRTTVVDLTQTPWQVLREGAVPGQSVLRFFNSDSK